MVGLSKIHFNVLLSVLIQVTQLTKTAHSYKSDKVNLLMAKKKNYCLIMKKIILLTKH